MIKKPSKIFDRDADWETLVKYVEHDAARPTLGIVSGRRRQGKSYLLNALAEATDGFYFEATQAAEAESLLLFNQALGQFTSAPAPGFTRWDDALGYLFTLGANRQVPLIVDEFPYLIQANPAIPSFLQRHLDTHWNSTNTESRARLLLCGSAMSTMGKLLVGSAPLRGRAGLEMIVRPLGHQDAANFWGATDPLLAVLLQCVVGGTPAYRRQLIRDDAPVDLNDFDAWVCRTVLNPGMPIFREGRYLLAEEIESRDPGLYHSVLGAIANGNAGNGGIASYLERKSAEIAHPLHVLEDCQLITRDIDVFRAGRAIYRIAEPLITFYQSIMRPRWALLERGGAEQVWRAAQPTFLSKVVGPRFEWLCREWTLEHSWETDFPAGRVGAGVVADPERKTQIEIDVVTTSPEADRQILTLGEVKWGTTMGLPHLERLERARELLAKQRWDIEHTVLTCYSGAGFTDELVAHARSRDDVALVDPAQLYVRG